MPSRTSLAALLAAILVTTASPVRGQPSAASGSVYVVSLPSGADIWVDGAYVGHSPVLLDALTPGRHTLSAARNGWSSQEIDVTVPAGSLAFQKIQLQWGGGAHAMGRLAIHGASSAAVVVDGTISSLGPNGTLDLSAGAHDLTIRAARGRVKRRVTIYPETTTTVVLRDSTNEAGRAAVVAPAARYLDAEDFALQGRRLTIHHNGHVVVGALDVAAMRIDGAPIEFDSAPAVIGGKLYLPVELFVRLGAVPTKAK